MTSSTGLGPGSRGVLATRTRLPRVSTKFVWWDRRQEWYEEGSLCFDVTLAKSYLARIPVRVDWLPVDRFGPWLVIDPATGRKGRRSAALDSARLARTDPSFPLVLVDVPGTRSLIDGHHRLERGRQDGQEEFPVVTIRVPRVVRELARERTARPVFWWRWSLLPWARGWRSRRPHVGSPAPRPS